MSMRSDPGAKGIVAVAFDVEIGNTIEPFSEWRNHRPLDITCVGLALKPDRVMSFHNERPPAYIDQECAQSIVETLKNNVLCSNRKIITFNGLAFDFVVLADASGMWEDCRRLALSHNHVDLMFNVYMRLGYNVGLNTACQETIGKGKTVMTGKEAIGAWHAGRCYEVIDYVKEDARNTLELYLALEENQRLCWRTKGGRGAFKQLLGNSSWSPTWPVAKTLQDVEPPEIPHWMNDPITMTHFLEVWNAVREKN